jgi:hypothetical protein
MKSLTRFGAPEAQPRAPEPSVVGPADNPHNQTHNQRYYFAHMNASRQRTRLSVGSRNTHRVWGHKPWAGANEKEQRHVAGSVTMRTVYAASQSRGSLVTAAKTYDIGRD